MTATTNRELMPEIIWTSYLRYRATRRGFDLDLIENILRFSSERYYDVQIDRAIVVGKHGEQLVLIPYKQNENVIHNFQRPRSIETAKKWAGREYQAKQK